MDRKPLHDILTPGDGPRRSKRSATSQTQVREVERERKKRGGGIFQNWKIWGGILLGVALFGFLLSFFFGDARISVHPKQATTFVNGTFSAQKNGGDRKLSYQTISLERTETKEVRATGEEDVEERASGKIVVFNSFSSDSQRLIRNTRFQTPEGLVYRIRDSISVPGFTREDGEIAPGSLEVTVYADEPGEEYNIGLADFKLPGFKDAGLKEQYEDFYARSKTSMTGGFIGVRKSVEEGELARARAELQETLRNDLRNAAQSEKPESFYLFEESIYYTFEASQRESEGDNAFVEEKGTLHGILFEKEALARFIAQETLASYDGGRVEILNPSELSVRIEIGETERPWTLNELPVSLEGEIRLVWNYDEAQLKEDLAGKDKAALPTILSGYQSIERAEVVVRPFWAQAFPENPEEISVSRILD
ncbi:MAG: hypothetical protein WDZ90_03070 [Candidatus Paceibacterota bacterium]